MRDHLELFRRPAIWGVPYYGGEGSTTSSALNSTTNGILTSGAGTLSTTWAKRAAEGGLGRHRQGAVVSLLEISGRHVGAGLRRRRRFADRQVRPYQRPRPEGDRRLALLMDGARPSCGTPSTTTSRVCGSRTSSVRCSAPTSCDRQRGHLRGMRAELLRPRNVVTREQMASFLARAPTCRPQRRILHR